MPITPVFYAVILLLKGAVTYRFPVPNDNILDFPTILLLNVRNIAIFRGRKDFLNIGIYLQMNLVSIFLCLLLYYQQKRHNAFSFLGTSAFNSILWTAIFIMTVDIISWLMVGGLLPHTPELLMLVQCVYYFLQAFLPLLFLEYGIGASKQASNLLFRILRYIPVAFTLVVLILNFNRRFAFGIVDGAVKRGDGFLFVILAPMLYLTLCLIFCAVFYFYTSPERKKISFHMFICTLIAFIGAVLSALIPSLSPWHTFVFSLVYLYMQLHSDQERTLDLLAYTDSLTGLKNYAAYSHLKQLTNQKLTNDPDFRFAVAIMDINDLKKVNDAYGHTAGNELICRSSQFICDVFRHSPVCRIGGDEFIAILEHSDYENRDALKAQFEALLPQTTFSVDGQQLPISVALGISAYQPELHRSFNDVLHDADQAMYAHKIRFKKDHCVQV